MKQYEAVIETLKRLGGCATFGQLNQEVFKIEDCTWNTKTPFASIRRIVQDRKEIWGFCIIPWIKMLNYTSISTKLS